ncbi:tripartite motif-containing protein 16-like isoform X3 [Conger conger]|uniref:tripartite motif-containing protein 16-like isoform X3 n=1 Tax=Conger conger TaxID=82655 RepID=UPI002A5B0CCD|nr:tripartite motif-containing protein 16-like isoform X3 [Conger conger]
MAEAAGLLDQDQFSCSICLDLLKNPVTIPCGHSYCMGCIKGYWDQDDHTGVYSCPQCRETFTPRPVLRKNTMFSEMLEKLKKTGLQAAPPAHCYAGPGDVACDVCTGRKHKAIKSCLVCLASYCETHLKIHNELNPGKRHKMVNVTGNLEEMICSNHDKLLEVYCYTDQQCICYLCTMDKHSGHETVSAAAARTEKQKQLGEFQSEFQQGIQEREKELQDLRQAVQSLKRSAQAAVKDSERIFTEMIRSIERRCSEVKELIRDQEKAEVSRAEGLLERLEQEIAELRRRDAELEQLSHTEDHIHFLQSCQSVCAPPGPGDLPNITVSPHVSFEAVRKYVSVLKERLENVFMVELVTISESVKEVHTVEPRTREDFFLGRSAMIEPINTQTSFLGQSPFHRVKEFPSVEPRTREDFFQYFCQLTLDPNTVHKQLWLSEGNRVVTSMGELQFYPHHPERFDCQDQDPRHPSLAQYHRANRYRSDDHYMFQSLKKIVVRTIDAQKLYMYNQVLCREGLSGRCYWEAEWSGNDYVSIAVTYKEISRKGPDDACFLGGNNMSWALRCSPSRDSFSHNNMSTEIPGPSSSRIGVYLDHRAGTLSFYSVSDTMTLLYRVQTTFTQPLYPGFGLGLQSSIRLCDL